MPITPQELDRRFDYHRPDEDRARRHQTVNAETKRLAAIIVNATPQGREQALAITKLEEVRMWANAAIACAPPPSSKEAPAEEATKSGAAVKKAKTTKSSDGSGPTEAK